MNFWHSIGGTISISITSAEPEKALSVLNDMGIRLRDILFDEPLTFRCTIHRRDWKNIRMVCKEKGYRLSLVQKSGIYWLKEKIILRPVLFLCLCLLLFLVIVLPTRVLFFEVNGNTSIPDKKILEAAENCGIRFGASRRTIRSEKMKNALLAELPELQWAGINTFGCRAVISVKEGEKTTPGQSITNITGIVAARDGVITSCTVTKGNPVCAVGQTVKKNQLLISPYVDCGLCIKVVPAEGEVMAQTSRNIRAVIPSDFISISPNAVIDKRYSLIFGKKRINLQNGSGICDATCGRMYKEYHIKLPGGFRLPVSLAVESIISRTASTIERSKPEVEQLLSSYLEKYVSQQMIAGTVLSENHFVEKRDDVWILDSSFVCSEMIGRVAAERNGVLHE